MLTDVDQVWLEAVRLAGAACLHTVIVDQAYVYMLVECWDSQRNTSHFPIGEMMITLEDIYQILWVPIEGRQVMTSKHRVQMMQRVFGDAWQIIDTEHRGIEYARAYEEGLLIVQQVMVMMIISSFLLLDSSGLRMPWNLLDVTSDIIKDGVVFVWAPTILQQIYKQLVDWQRG